MEAKVYCRDAALVYGELAGVLELDLPLNVEQNRYVLHISFIPTILGEPTIYSGHCPQTSS